MRSAKLHNNLDCGKEMTERSEDVNKERTSRIIKMKKNQRRDQLLGGKGRRK